MNKKVFIKTVVSRNIVFVFAAPLAIICGSENARSQNPTSETDSPAIHLNANGQVRFNPRPEQFFPPATVANNFHLPTHGASFGFGASVMITPDTLALFDFTPCIGFKLGRVNAIFGNNFNVTGFQNVSQPAIGFGIQRNIGRHAFALTFSNTQTTTTSRYNSSNLAFSPRRLVIGFNLFRRF